MFDRTYFEKIECDFIGGWRIDLIEFISLVLLGGEIFVMVRGVRRGDLEDLIRGEIASQAATGLASWIRERLNTMATNIINAEIERLTHNYDQISSSKLRFTIDPNRFNSPLDAKAYQMGWVYQIAHMMQLVADGHGASSVVARQYADYAMEYLIRVAFLNLSPGARQRYYNQLDLR